MKPLISVMPFGVKLSVVPIFSYELAVIRAVRTSGEKSINSLHCVAKKEKSERVPELRWERAYRFITRFPHSIHNGWPIMLDGLLKSWLRAAHIRGLRYYRIGIENTILLAQSIVSVSYQYRNSQLEKYQYQYRYRNFRH